MAQRRRKKPSLVSRLRASLKVAHSKLKRKKKPMAFNRSRTRFGRGRSNYGGGQRRSFRRKSYGGGFSNRLPFLGIRIPKILIWVAIIGGGWFIGKDKIAPLIAKLKSGMNA
jgi:hypothetical protein